MQQHSVEHGDGSGQLGPLESGEQLALVLGLLVHTLPEREMDGQVSAVIIPRGEIVVHN